jgi:hypothetical protein
MIALKAYSSNTSSEPWNFEVTRMYLEVMSRMILVDIVGVHMQSTT